MLSKLLLVDGWEVYLLKVEETETEEAKSEAMTSSMPKPSGRCVLSVTRAKQPRRGRMSTELTPYEIEILDLVKLGYKDKEIGAELGIALGTVKQHLQFIYAKLGAVNRVDAVVKALRAGYLQLD